MASDVVRLYGLDAKKKDNYVNRKFFHKTHYRLNFQHLFHYVPTIGSKYLSCVRESLKPKSKDIHERCCLERHQ